MIKLLPLTLLAVSAFAAAPSALPDKGTTAEIRTPVKLTDQNKINAIKVEVLTQDGIKTKFDTLQKELQAEYQKSVANLNAALAEARKSLGLPDNATFEYSTLTFTVPPATPAKTEKK